MNEICFNTKMREIYYIKCIAHQNKEKVRY